MTLWNSLAGMVRLQFTTADVSGLLLAMERGNIILRDVVFLDALTVQFRIYRTDLKKLQRLAADRGEHIRILSEEGIYYSLQGLLKRPVLVTGLLLLILLSLWVPGRIFFVYVEGNQTVPTDKILEQAALCGIDFGASRREVRSERMKNALLEQMPQLQWAGVNTRGCVAVISVREREESTQEGPSCQISSIVALRDGVVREMTVLNGNPVCAVGQAVKAGQVLISGYTDCGICIRAEQAKGEVYAETKRELTAIFPCDYEKRGEICSTQKKFSLIIGKKRINFYNSSGISDGSCVKIYTEQYVTLPGGFVLPVAIVTETWISYAYSDMTYEDPEHIVQPFIQNYLQSTMIAGRVCGSVQTQMRTDDVYRIDGVYSCYEMIGITRPEESLSNYEDN